MKSFSWQFDRYGEPSEELYWREETLPDLGPGEALVQIRVIGMNRSEYNSVRGQYFPGNHFPSRIGTEAVGEILALGPPLEIQSELIHGTKMEVGARVATIARGLDESAMGTYRDIGIYPQSALAPVPNSYSDEEGAAFWMAVLTMGGAMEMAGFSAANATGKNVLITAGASGMGVIALKLAKHWGAKTIATTRNAAKALELGSIAEGVVVCSDSESLAEGVRNITGKEGVHLAIDPVGAAFYPGLLEVIAPGGDIVSYECMTGTRAYISIMDMMLKNMRFHGYTIYRPLNDQQLLNQLIQLGLNNADVIRPIISQSFNLSDAPQALQKLGQSDHLGKIVIKAQ
jgi:NADPH2:quinone reductase